jgi:hypothetical protein
MLNNQRVNHYFSTSLSASKVPGFQHCGSLPVFGFGKRQRDHYQEIETQQSLLLGVFPHLPGKGL